MSELGDVSVSRELMERTEVHLRGDENRVLCRLFVPGEEELIRGTSRARELISRCLALSEEDVHETLDGIIASYANRHRDLIEHLDQHFLAVTGLIKLGHGMSVERKRLIGAYLTQEYSFEAAAYFNPSMVLHPDQTGVETGECRFVMSVRAVGEGHVSTIVFRTGVIGATGLVEVDPACRFATTRAQRYTVLRNKMIEQAAKEAQVDTADLQYVLGMLPPSFTPDELTANLNLLDVMNVAAADVQTISEIALDISRTSYEVSFSADTEITERVLWPTANNERRGMEDARFVLCTEDDETSVYRATYTGFDGTQVVSRLLETEDFVTFSSMTLTGPAIRNKGVAIFPRKVDGRYLALSRWDRETNSIATSDDGYHWHDAGRFQAAVAPWELLHVGNCGSPIELDAGWLVLTHGAGPMRRYCIGALLLDKENPTKVLARLPNPLLEPNEEERNGYVPNVVYSCGGLIHNGRLVLPYGFSDFGTKVAVGDVSELLASME
jgi:predicted GH43/DUF377 family glycosyl hydrolase